jgi:hypothetical protein
MPGVIAGDSSIKGRRGGSYADMTTPNRITDYFMSQTFVTLDSPVSNSNTKEQIEARRRCFPV